MATSRPARNGSERFEAIARSYKIPDVPNSRKLFLLVSDKYNDVLQSIDNYLQLDRRHDCDQIVNNVYLSRIPTKEGFDLPANLGLVIGVVAEQEMAGKGLMKTVYEPDDWKERGIQHIHVNIQDLTADVSSEDVLDAVEKMHQYIDDHPDKAVLVHCKAGRSRSAMLVAIYLALHGDKYGLPHSENLIDNFDAALSHIKNIRPHVIVLPTQAAKAQEVMSFFSPLTKRRHDTNQVRDKTYDSRGDYLASLDAKDDIRRLNAFKSLAVYATKIQYLFMSCQRTNHIREFFDDILYSTDGDWYNRLVAREGAVRKLLDADKGSGEFGTADRQRREELISCFETEVNDLLVQQGLFDANDNKIKSPS